MITSRDLFGKEHTILPCTVDDVAAHFEKIRSTVTTDTEETPFKQKMLQCIEAGTAYKLSDESCFFYYLNSTSRLAEGVALFGQGNPAKITALFRGVTGQIDTQTLKVSFHRHKGKALQEYRNIVTLTSLKRQSIEGYPLVIRMDELKAKADKLYLKMGIE